jgi:hypothetical protein
VHRVQRRQFLSRSIALALLSGLRAEAQPRTYRMASLSGGTEASGAHLQKALLGRLEELGYREGRNLVVERRFADARPERLPALAAELVALKPDLIFGGAAFKTLEMQRPDVLYVVESPLTVAHRARIVASANGARLPAVYGLQGFVEAGGLMSYSFIYIEQFRAAATFIDKILKGAKPADLPVEQPTRFELVLDLKTAKALGVKFPQSILLRADRVIE